MVNYLDTEAAVGATRRRSSVTGSVGKAGTGHHEMVRHEMVQQREKVGGAGGEVEHVENEGDVSGSGSGSEKF